MMTGNNWVIGHESYQPTVPLRPWWMSEEPTPKDKKRELSRVSTWRSMMISNMIINRTWYLHPCGFCSTMFDPPLETPGNRLLQLPRLKCGRQKKRLADGGETDRPVLSFHLPMPAIPMCLLVHWDEAMVEQPD